MRAKAFTGTIAAALGIFAAISGPAAAANDPDLTHPTGTMLATGTKLLAIDSGIVKVTTSTGTHECTNAGMTGVLTKNNGSEVEANIETAGFWGTGTGEDCTGPMGSVVVRANAGANGIPWCLRSTAPMAADEVQIRGNSCSGASRPIRLELEPTSPLLVCVYERSTALVGTFQTHPSDLVVSFTNQSFPKISGSFLCPSEFKLDMSFTFETDGISNQPIYIS